MAAKPRIVALVPMRDNSERVPGKNYRPLAGRPLFHHILLALADCKQIDQVVVDTDSPTIKTGVEADFPNVMLIDRPQQLRAGEIPMNEILLHDTSQFPADYYLQTHSTNPLLQSVTIEKAIDTFLKEIPEKDSLFGVTELHTRLYDFAGKAINHNPSELLRTQDLPPVYEENSCIYIFSRQGLLKNDHRIGKSPVMFPIPREQAWDIDEELDFQVVDFLMQRRLKSQ
ncbi:MAG TPA: acylneuraminate cytidylyltransferase family protein [Terriglobales bacterium]|nr:acylneuraminate cytidylyltransferase family protein [Terriglobales bacterium]